MGTASSGKDSLGSSADWTLVTLDPDGSRWWVGQVSVRIVQITIDCADPGRLAEFWCQVLGYRTDPPPPGFDSWDAFLDSIGVPQDQRNSRSGCSDPDGVGPRLFFQQVPEPKQVKNRLHLDVRAAPGLAGEERMTAFEAEAARLVELGASRVQRVEPSGMDGGWIVMADPEGNEFCLD